MEEGNKKEGAYILAEWNVSIFGAWIDLEWKTFPCISVWVALGMSFGRSEPLESHVNNRNDKNWCTHARLRTEGGHTGSLLPLLECYSPSLQDSLRRRRCSCLAGQDARKRG